MYYCRLNVEYIEEAEHSIFQENQALTFYELLSDENDENIGGNNNNQSLTSENESTAVAEK